MICYTLTHLGFDAQQSVSEKLRMRNNTNTPYIYLYLLLTTIKTAQGGVLFQVFFFFYQSIRHLDC